MQAVASPRWRISPLTSLPVHWSGYKCSAGTNADSGVSTAKECQSVCESQSTCGYFSWNTEGESADAGIERCVWSTDAQCATKTSAKYVTYRKPKTSVDALLFPSSASKKYVKISGVGALNEEFSTSFWVKATSLDASGTIVSKNDGAGWHVKLKEGKLYFGGMNSAWGTSGIEINVGQWHHVTATFSKSGAKAGIYLDGGNNNRMNVYDDLTAEGNVALTDANDPVLVGRGESKLSGVRLAGVAVYEEALTAENAKALFEGTATPANVGNTKIVVLVDGVLAGGTISDGSGKNVATIDVLLHVPLDGFASAITKMTSVEDGSPTSDLVLAASNLKSCGMSINIQAATSVDANCIYDNNRHCEPGIKTCTQTACNTPGDDEARIWALCQPEDKPLNFAVSGSLSKSTNHIGQELSCPAGSVIGLGFAIQSTNDRGDLDSCFEKK
jgi:hypothetical protein